MDSRCDQSDGAALETLAACAARVIRHEYIKSLTVETICLRVAQQLHHPLTDRRDHHARGSQIFINIRQVRQELIDAENACQHGSIEDCQSFDESALHRPHAGHRRDGSESVESLGPPGFVLAQGQEHLARALGVAGKMDFCLFRRIEHMADDSWEVVPAHLNKREVPELRIDVWVEIFVFSAISVAT